MPESEIDCVPAMRVSFIRGKELEPRWAINVRTTGADWIQAERIVDCDPGPSVEDAPCDPEDQLMVHAVRRLPRGDGGGDGFVVEAWASRETADRRARELTESSEYDFRVTERAAINRPMGLHRYF